MLRSPRLLKKNEINKCYNIKTNNRFDKLYVHVHNDDIESTYKKIHNKKQPYKKTVINSKGVLNQSTQITARDKSSSKCQKRKPIFTRQNVSSIKTDSVQKHEQNQIGLNSKNILSNARKNETIYSPSMQLRKWRNIQNETNKQNSRHFNSHNFQSQKKFDILSQISKTKNQNTDIFERFILNNKCFHRQMSVYISSFFTQWIKTHFYSMQKFI